MLKYPVLSIPGIAPDEEWQLYNVSNYEYYKLKIAKLLVAEPVCEFCQIDPRINDILPIANDSWVAWVNTVSPQPGTSLQLLMVLRRHVTAMRDLEAREYVDLGLMIEALDARFRIDGGSFVIRSGPAAFNAKSVDHFHVNYVVADGSQKVQVTLGKSQDDIDAKLPVLVIWEKMRLLQLTKSLTTQEAFEALFPEEKVLVADKLAPKTK